MEEVEYRRPVHLYFNRNFLEITPEIEDFIQNSGRDIYVCKDWGEIGDKLHLYPSSIAVHYSELKHISANDIVNMIRTLSSLVGLSYKILISITISKTTTYSEFKELQKSGIIGIVPDSCDFGFAETKLALNAQWAGQEYWPKNIINQLPGAVKKLPKPAQEVVLTDRQQQILDLLNQRGMTNKGIARHLNISESTVKLHMSSIFKKYGVRNRTQLAVFSQKQSAKP